VICFPWGAYKLMPLNMTHIAKTRKRSIAYKALSLGPWSHGLNTAKPAFEIEPSELSYNLNMVGLRNGRWKTRPGISQYTTAATTSNSAPKHFELCPISSNNYQLLVDDNDVLYYLTTALVPVEIKDATEGDTTILPFAGTAMVFDTSYIKFCDLTNITGATKANPCVITYDGRSLRNGQSITINGVVGMTQLNGNSYTVAGLDTDAKTFQLSGINSSAYTTYVSGGVASMLAIAYDKGSGTTGFQFDNSSGDDDTSLALGNGTNTRIAWKFTSQTWDTGYSIPPLGVSAKLQLEGNGYTGTDNVDITMVVRAVSDDSVLATKTLVEAPIATNVSDTAAAYTAAFTSDDTTTEMATATDYYLSLEYNNGDATNYIHVRCTTVASGGHGYHYAGSWSADATADPIISLSPGRPPKGSWGVVSDNHLIVYNPDNPGKPVFSGPGDFLDWSTSTLAGYVGAVDDDANNFPVGAMADHYGDLFIFGTKAQPYLAKLEGTSPTDWVLPRLYQKVSSTHKTCISVVNDIWYADRPGVDGLSGVQEYGDLRTFFASDPVYDRIEDNFDEDTAIAGYYPIEGQYFLYMPTYHRVLVAHTKIPSNIQASDEGEGGYVRYPWSEYEFYKDILTSSTYKWTASDSGTNEYYVQTAAGGDPSIATQPDFLLKDGNVITEGTVGSLSDHEWDYGDNDSLGYDTVYFRDESGDPDATSITIHSVLAPTMFANFNNLFFIGSSDGYIYQIDSSEYKDQGSHAIRFAMRSGYISFPFTHVHIVQQQVTAASLSGGQLDLKVWTDDQQLDSTYTLSIDDTMTVDQATMYGDDALFSVDPALAPRFQFVGITARSLQAGVENIISAGYPIYVDGILFKYKTLSG